jgi:tetratricopeptide (TPR) repeat protein
VYAFQGDYDKALEYYEKSLSIILSVLGDNHPDVAISYNNIGNVYAFQGDYDKALKYYEKALKISFSVSSKDDSDINNIRKAIAEVREKLSESSGSSSGGSFLSRLFKKKK